MAPPGPGGGERNASVLSRVLNFEQKEQQERVIALQSSPKARNKSLSYQHHNHNTHYECEHKQQQPETQFRYTSPEKQRHHHHHADVHASDGDAGVFSRALTLEQKEQQEQRVAVFKSPPKGRSHSQPHHQHQPQVQMQQLPRFPSAAPEMQDRNPVDSGVFSRVQLFEQKEHEEREAVLQQSPRAKSKQGVFSRALVFEHKRDNNATAPFSSSPSPKARSKSAGPERTSAAAPTPPSWASNNSIQSSFTSTSKSQNNAEGRQGNSKHAIPNSWVNSHSPSPARPSRQSPFLGRKQLRDDSSLPSIASSKDNTRQGGFRNAGSSSPVPAWAQRSRDHVQSSNLSVSVGSVTQSEAIIEEVDWPEDDLNGLDWKDEGDIIIDVTGSESLFAFSSCSTDDGIYFAADSSDYPEQQLGGEAGPAPAPQAHAPASPLPTSKVNSPKAHSHSSTVSNHSPKTSLPAATSPKTQIPASDKKDDDNANFQNNTTAGGFAQANYDTHLASSSLPSNIFVEHSKQDNKKDIHIRSISSHKTGPPASFVIKGEEDKTESEAGLPWSHSSTDDYDSNAILAKSETSFANDSHSPAIQESMQQQQLPNSWPTTATSKENNAPSLLDPNVNVVTNSPANGRHATATATATATPSVSNSLETSTYDDADDAMTTWSAFTTQTEVTEKTMLTLQSAPVYGVRGTSNASPRGSRRMRHKPEASGNNGGDDDDDADEHFPSSPARRARHSRAQRLKSTREESLSPRRRSKSIQNHGTGNGNYGTLELEQGRIDDSSRPSPTKLNSSKRESQDLQVVATTHTPKTEDHRMDADAEFEDLMHDGDGGTSTTRKEGHTHTGRYHHLKANEDDDDDPKEPPRVQAEPGRLTRGVRPVSPPTNRRKPTVVVSSSFMAHANTTSTRSSQEPASASVQGTYQELDEPIIMQHDDEEDEYTSFEQKQKRAESPLVQEQGLAGSSDDSLLYFSANSNSNDLDNDLGINGYNNHDGNVDVNVDNHHLQVSAPDQVRVISKDVEHDVDFASTTQEHQHPPIAESTNIRENTNTLSAANTSALHSTKDIKSNAPQPPSSPLLVVPTSSTPSSNTPTPTRGAKSFSARRERLNSQRAKQVLAHQNQSSPTKQLQRRGNESHSHTQNRDDIHIQSVRPTTDNSTPATATTRESETIHHQEEEKVQIYSSEQRSPDDVGAVEAEEEENSDEKEEKQPVPFSSTPPPHLQKAKPRSRRSESGGSTNKKKRESSSSKLTTSSILEVGDVVGSRTSRNHPHPPSPYDDILRELNETAAGLDVSSISTGGHSHQRSSSSSSNNNNNTKEKRPRHRQKEQHSQQVMIQEEEDEPCKDVDDVQDNNEEEETPPAPLQQQHHEEALSGATAAAVTVTAPTPTHDLAVWWQNTYAVAAQETEVNQVVEEVAESEILAIQTKDLPFRRFDTTFGQGNKKKNDPNHNDGRPGNNGLPMSPLTMDPQTPRTQDGDGDDIFNGADDASQQRGVSQAIIAPPAPPLMVTSEKNSSKSESHGFEFDNEENQQSQQLVGEQEQDFAPEQISSDNRHRPRGATSRRNKSLSPRKKKTDRRGRRKLRASPEDEAIGTGTSAFETRTTSNSSRGEFHHGGASSSASMPKASSHLHVQEASEEDTRYTEEESESRATTSESGAGGGETSTLVMEDEEEEEATAFSRHTESVADTTIQSSSKEHSSHGLSDTEDSKRSNPTLDSLWTAGSTEGSSQQQSQEPGRKTPKGPISSLLSSLTCSFLEPFVGGFCDDKKEQESTNDVSDPLDQDDFLSSTDGGEMGGDGSTVGSPDTSKEEEEDTFVSTTISEKVRQKKKNPLFPIFSKPFINYSSLTELQRFLFCIIF
jgi:hypothetical protein